jgi:hypothetical protein
MLTKLKYHPTAIEVRSCHMLGEIYTNQAKDFERAWLMCPVTNQKAINDTFKSTRKFYKDAVRIHKGAKG